MVSGVGSPEFMSVVLTFILPSAIVFPSTVFRSVSPPASGLPRPGPGCKIGDTRCGLARPAGTSGGDHGTAKGSAALLDLDRRRTRTLEGRQDSRADARAALSQHGVR